jgi:Sec-independent protein translocase protein TatA
MSIWHWLVVICVAVLLRSWAKSLQNWLEEWLQG